MKKKHSLIGHVLAGNFRIIAAVVTVCIIIVFVSMCNSYRSKIINDARTQLTDSTRRFVTEVESAIYHTDALVRNESIMQGLDTEFDRNYKIVDFLGDLSSFVADFDKEPWGIDKFIIYSENPTLINSGHVRNRLELRDFNYIRNTADPGMQYISWKKDIEEFKGRSYLTLYRYIPLKYDCIAEHKVFTDGIFPEDNVYKISLIREPKSGLDKDPMRLFQPLMEGFVLTAEIDRGMLMKQYLIYLVKILLCGLGLLLLTFFLSERSVKTAMKDILSLINKIQGGDILTYDDDEEWSELAIIKNKISDLTKSLHDVSVREYKNELIRRKLEVSILNAKINPHLIYNSLSVIKLVAFRQKCMEVCDATDTLVNYYRLVLNKGEDTISVAMELEYLEKYIGIYKISKKKEYEVDYDVCEEAFDIDIPHLLLQPILENALIHGLNTAKHAYISITVYCEGDRLHIKIGDNGIGMDEETLARLNRHEGMGYGLNSVLQRADFYYGGDFRFSFESQQGVGTTVSLDIPRNITRSI